MSHATSPQSPYSSSNSSSSFSGYKVEIPSPEVATVKEILLSMKASLDKLSTNFDSMGERTARVAVMGGDIETAQQLNGLRKQMQKQEAKQEENIEEIKQLLKEVLEEQIVDYLKEKIAQQIEEQIEDQVRDQVAAELEQYIPKELQEELQNHHAQLQEVQRALHNSESRRANAVLRSSRVHEPLRTLYKTNGEVSTLYPKDLTSLLALDSDTAKQLVLEYELPDGVSDSREKNINRFMQFCGVSYQMIPMSSGTTLS